MTIDYNRAAFYYDDLQDLLKRLEAINTPNLSRIKKIMNRIQFCDITDPQQVARNLGNAYYRVDIKGEGHIFKNLQLDYTITNKKTGVSYGDFNFKKNEDGETSTTFKPRQFHGYGRFIADLIAKKVIYFNGYFRIVEDHTYTTIKNETALLHYYPVPNNRDHISDFLDVFQQIYAQFTDYNQPYTVHPYALSGRDFLMNFKTRDMRLNQYPTETDLFFQFYDVSYADLDFNRAKNYVEMVSANDKSLKNLLLLHAYIYMRMLDLVPPSKFFIMKDFGRTGKGLFIKSLEGFANIHRVEFDNLVNGSGIEKSNEWANFYGADVVHANETGAITPEQMRILRRIASGESVTGRYIGQNNFKFNISAPLVLDTNEIVDIGQITANRSRAVKIAFKDRPHDETEAERVAIFAPYWDFITSEKTKVIASLSFLANSLDQLDQDGGRFSFEDTPLPQYYDADDLTDTQKILLFEIHENGYIEANNPTLQMAILQDYGKLSTKRAQQDIKAIGVATNKAKWIDGKTVKVNTIKNKELFNIAYKLVSESMLATT
ncbi:MAG: phage resistance protein [Aerococcus sp.]|nr:phage resistance protein [Aerococcus sp.]